jgi:hypothetical protein
MCKNNPDDHPPHTRRGEKTSEGTSNLKAGADKCDAKHGICSGTSESSSQLNIAIAYTPAAHCALILLRCAKNNRPFNSVLDKDYQAEVQMLRPGTEIPHPITISRDARTVYLELSKRVREYFVVNTNFFYFLLFELICFSVPE